MLNHFKTSLKSIWGNKVRSLLTVLGIVIGVASVTTLVSLGQGLQNDVSSLIRGLGTNIVVVMSGQAGALQSSSGQDQQQQMSQVNPANFLSGDILTSEDVKTIKQIENIEEVAPMTLVTGAVIKKDDERMAPMIVGVTPNFMETMEVLEIENGGSFETAEDIKEIIIGPGLKDTLFGEENEAVGKTLTVKDEEYTVKGVLARPKSTNLFASDFDFIAMVTQGAAYQLNEEDESIIRIMLKANEEADVNQVKEQITQKLKENHDGEEDFTVFTQEDLLDVFSQFLNMATALVSAIAAISLIVGGIGIMNIMLVTVTERTKEIGLRKAIGATKTAILGQFLIEAIVITLIGGGIGLGLSFLGNIVIAQQTPIQPVITLNTILVAVSISVGIGIIFGIWPALNAARKDPIEALRHE